MAEIKSWRDYSKYNSTKGSTEESVSSKNTGSWRDYSKLESGSSAGTANNWRRYSTMDTASIVGGNIVNRVNSWLNNHNSYITDYQKRYEGRKYNYEDAYVSDSSDWMNTVSQRKSNFDTEAETILSYMDQHKDYLDKDWVADIRKTIATARGTQNQIFDSVTKDNEYWSKFTPNEEQTAAGYTAEKLYNEWQTGQKQYAADQAFDVEAGMLELEELKKEKDAYLVDQEEKRKKAESEESFWDSLGRWLGNTPDTTIPLAGVSATSSGNSYTNEYDKRIAELEDQIERSKYVQGYEGYMDNMDAEDYAANSKYISTRTDVAMDDARWGFGNTMYDESKLFGDFLYDYINGNQDALDVATVNDTALDANLLGLDKGFLKTLTKDEIGVFNAIYKNQSPEAAYEFVKFIESDLKGRKRAQEQAFWAGYAKENPVGSSVFSTLISPLKGLSYLGQAADMLDDGKMEENAGYNRFSYIPSTIRSQVSTTIENSGKWGKVGSFAYNTGMSMADFLFTTAVSGGNQALSLGIMGSGAAADATLAAKDRGLDDGQAFALGTIAGLAEVAMEKISLGAWLDGDMTEGALKYLLKNALSEGGEEASTSVINLLADVIIAGDKSEWNVAMQAYIDEGKSPEEAFGLVAAEQAAQIGLDALGGMLSGSAIGGSTYAGASIGAAINYGKDAKNKTYTQNLVNEGLELNPDNQYIQKMQGKVSNGKNLTGMQVRNLLAANKEQITAKDMKLIQQSAEKRLTDLGQTENVSKLAEIATKWATGQEITRAEKKLITNSQYGSRVANELLPSNIESGNYATGWAEDIGTKQVNAQAYNKTKIDQVRSIIEQMKSMEDPNSYKSLESRMEEDTTASVSDTGKAVIRATNEEIDLTNPNFKAITEDGVVLDVNGKDVRSNDIDYDSEEQGLAINAIGKIEHITPATAGALYAKVDMTKPVMGQLNGMDEAFTYGYYNYSEADLEAGLFAKNLTNDQLKDAYNLGRYVAENSTKNRTEAIKKMRTAADAIADKNAKEGKETPKSKNLTITYNHGGGVIEDIETAEKKLGKLNKEQRAGIEVAKILHMMGLGTNYEFFNSYNSKTLTDKDGNPLEVFLNDEGQEEAAYAGVYLAADGKIRINLNAYSGTKGLVLNAMSHELVHFIKTWSLEKYNAMAEFLVKSYGDTNLTMHQLVLKEQNRLKGIRGKEVGYGEAYDEVVANALNRMFDDGKVLEKLNELTAQDRGLVEKILEGIKQFVKRFMKVYQNNQSLFKETEALMEMKEAFEQLQNMFAEALADASANFQASLIAKEAGLEVVPVEDSTQYSYQSLAEAAGFEAVQNEDGTRSFVRDGQAVSKVTVEDIENSPIGAFINFSLEMKDISEADAKRQKEMFAKICTMACKTNDFAMTMQFVGSAVFTGMKANADKQYGTTYDFPSICTKTQAVIDAMSAKMVKLGRGLNTNEIVQLYDDVFASGNPVPCPECYVFSRWIGIGGLLDNIKKYQDYYGDMAVEDVAAEYRKMRAEVAKFAEEQGISFGKAKGALTAKLTKEFNKLTEKIEKAENQGEKVKPADRNRLTELEPMMNTVKGMTWLENVYFADSSLKKVNPNFRVPDSVLFDLNNGEAFATKYKEAWAFRTTQGAGYGKAITPYAEARLGEGILVTNNTSNAIKGKAQGSLNNYFLNQKGKLDKQSRDALKRARLKQKIQAFIGGQRFQSTSDARYENASDYLLAALEMQAMAGMVQVYTKVDGAVPAFSTWGFSINQSLMPLNGGLDANGNVKDTSVGGMKPSVAFENRKKHESAGTITIGVNDNHIRAMFKQLVRDFIIPYHASGGKADVVAAFRRIQEGKEAKGKAVRSTDYSRTQSDKVLSDEVLRWQGKTDAQIQRIHEIRNARIAILTGGKVNMTVVRSNRFLSALYDKLNGGEWDGVKLAKSKVESQIFPNEFWDQTVSYEESAKITRDYLEYCEDLGFLHRFSGTVPSNGRLVPVNGYNENGERVQLTDLAYKYDENGNKTAEVEEFFWKVLTDRRMYDNNGNYLPQKVVTLKDTTTDTITGFAKNNQGREYDKAKAEALAQKIVKGAQYSSQETDLDKDFDYSDLNWAFDLGIITGKDSAIFERTINNEIFRGAEPQSANGEYIIDTGKCLMFTDGDFHNPTLSRVIVFATEYESLTDYAKRRIIDEAEATGEVQLSLSAIESIFGEGFVSSYTRPDGQTYAGQNRGRKRSNGSGTAQRTRAKSIKERLEAEGKEHLLYSSQATDADYIRYDRRALLKESKVDEYLDDYAAKSSPKYAQAYIAYVRPRTFLKLTTDDVFERYHIADQAGELDEERLSDSRPGIYLRIDNETGQVTGHEGRHRMSAMDSAGIELVPVLLVDTSNKMTKTDIAEITLHGQFDETAMGIVKDLIPLNYENRDRVIKNFATKSSTQRIGERYGFSKTLRFSTQQTDNITNRHLLANAFEGITQNSIEYGMIQEYKGRIKLLNEYEEKLSKLNAEIRKLTFGTEGERDSKKLKQLQDEAKKVAENINRNDKKLLSLEASEPLRKVIERERKKESQKTKEHIQQIVQNKKNRAEQTEMRHKIRRVIRDLDKVLNRGNKKLNVKEDMKGFVSKALELADYLFTDHVSNDELIRKGITVRMTPKEAALVKETEDILSKLYDHADSLTDEEFARLDEKRKSNEYKLRDLLTAQRNERLNTPVYNLFNDLVTEYASLKNSSQDAVKAAYNDEVERLLRTFIGDADSDRTKALQNMRVADMTTEELWKLYNAYTMVLTTVRDANKFHVKGMNESIEQVVGRIAGDFSSRKIPDKKLAIAAQKLANKIGWDYEKLYYALDRIGSESFTELIMNLADSENTVMQDIIEAAAFRDDIVKKHGFNNWDVNKEIDREFLDNTGKKFKLTLGQLMSLYAYSRREGAWDHIEYGGFVFGKAALTNPKPADSYKLSKKQCEAITNTLTKEQKGYVEDMQKFLSETMGAKGNEVSMMLYGIKMFGEKNYFPIHIAGQFKAQAQESQAKQAAGFGSMSNAGFTHEQNPNAKAPFVLEGFNEVWSDHVNEMSRYHGTVPALEDIRRVMNRSTYSDSVAESQSIKQLMENSYGKEAVDYFDNLYREANSGAITDKLQKKSKKLLSLFRKNSVAYSLSVLIQQPASLVRAYALIDKKYFGFKGFGTITSGVAKAVSNKWTKAHTNAYNEMLQYAPGVTMAKEIGGFDTATGGSIRSYLLDTNKSIKQKWNTENALGKGKAVLDLVDNNAIANLPNVADKIAWIEIWNACKRETVATHKNLAPNSEAFMQAVGERFTEVIRATQVYDSIFAKSPMLKSKNLAVQYLVSFMNEPNTVANMVESAVRCATRGNWKQGARTAAVVVHSIIFTNVLKSIIYAMRDDDEDETYIEKYIEAISGGMMSDFNPLNYIPIARDAWSIAQGYDVERADMAIVADALDALDRVFKNAAKDTEDMTEEELAEFDKKVTDANWKLAESVAAFFGIPIKNVRREIVAVIDHAKIAYSNAGKTTKSSAWDTIGEAVIDSIPFMSTPSKQDKLYDAIISGDKTYLARLKDTYKTDDAYHTAVRKALRENDPRIKEAAQAHINGNPSERVRIAKLIKDDGFNQDDVVMAINAEINDMTPDDSSSETTKVKGLYKVEDFVREFANGDQASLDEIRVDILDTAQKNGKTTEEAENGFVSDVKSKAKDAYLDGSLDDATAERLLMEYADMEEDDAVSRVSYWAFCEEHQEFKDVLSESNVNDYKEFAEPAEIPLDVFVQYINGTKGLAEIKDEWGDVEVTKREQVLEVIDSLPLSWQQKDALYLAAGYSESKIWDVPW